jgi:hypothetical protein
MEAQLQHEKNLVSSERQRREQAEAQHSTLAKEATELKLALAEARSDARSVTEKLRVLREEKADSAKRFEEERSARLAAQEKSASVTNFAEQARQALADTKQNIRSGASLIVLIIMHSA